MKRNKQSSMLCGLLWLCAFILWTLLIQIVDVQPIGPNETRVGFSSLNIRFHHLTGVHMPLYVLTDWLGLVPLLICMFFGVMGLAQWIKRKHLLAVDQDILCLGVYYAAVILFYLVFEMIPINYRPILIEGALEASYPSSTTLLILCVMPTLSFQVKKRVKLNILQRTLACLSYAFSIFMVSARMICGVHWLSDIIGAILLSRGLFAIYQAAALPRCDKDN